MKEFVVLLVLAGQLPARDVRIKLFWRTPPNETQVKKLSAGLRIDARLVSTLNLEDYVAGVLAGEASTFTSAEAMKAVAVAARTFALYHLGRHRAEGFDFCDTTHCQDLRLSVRERSDIRKAVLTTESEALWFEGRATATHYHRHCGGVTAAAGEVWPGMRAPYLRTTADTFCISHGRAEWNSELPIAQLEGEPQITKRSPSGRVAEITIESKHLSAERFHQLVGDRFGWNILRSNAYGATKTGDRIRFSGFGHGHGVGLCQAGTEERGKAGHSYQAILGFYYPGTTLGVAASGLRWTYAAGERVDAFAVDAAVARELAATADDALKQAESVSGFSAMKRPVVRSYPTLAIYRDATGSSGDLAATTSGFVVRMQPMGLLRSRNALRSTLVHEMLHVLIDSHSYPQLPDWFSEGLTLYLSNTAPGLGAFGSSDLRGKYVQAAARIRRLADRYGRSTLLSWVRLGIPGEVLTPDAAPPKRTSAAPQR